MKTITALQCITGIIIYLSVSLEAKTRIIQNILYMTLYINNNYFANQTVNHREKFVIELTHKLQCTYAEKC